MKNQTSSAVIVSGEKHEKSVPSKTRASLTVRIGCWLTGILFGILLMTAVFPTLLPLLTLGVFIYCLIIILAISKCLIGLLRSDAIDKEDVIPLGAILILMGIIMYSSHDVAELTLTSIRTTATTLSKVPSGIWNVLADALHHAFYGAP